MNVDEYYVIAAYEKEVNAFYVRCAYAVGFPIWKRSSTRDDDGVLRYVTFTCNQEGRRRDNLYGSC